MTRTYIELVEIGRVICREVGTLQGQDSGCSSESLELIDDAVGRLMVGGGQGEILVIFPQRRVLHYWALAWLILRGFGYQRTKECLFFRKGVPPAELGYLSHTL